MSIQIKVKGLAEVISKLNDMPPKLRDVERIVVTQATNMIATEMRNRVHVVTGRLKSSIRTGYIGTNTGNVIVSAPYAAFENRRAGIKMGFGPHDFADQAITAVQAELDRLVEVSMREIFKE